MLPIQIERFYAVLETITELSPYSSDLFDHVDIALEVVNRIYVSDEEDLATLCKNCFEFWLSSKGDDNDFLKDNTTWERMSSALYNTCRGKIDLPAFSTPVGRDFNVEDITFFKLAEALSPLGITIVDDTGASKNMYAICEEIAASGFDKMIKKQ